MDAAELAMNNLKTYFMVAGLTNGLATVLGIVGGFVFGISTCGIGCLFLVLPLVNIGVMASDFIAYSKVREPYTPQLYSALRFAASFDLLACYALVPLVMGILNLQILGRPEVHALFHLNSIEPPTAPSAAGS